MTEGALASAFVVGLLGGVHCAGMCGGIVGALSLQVPGGRPKLPFHLAYNGGRILSYGVAGALVGTLGAGSLMLGGAAQVRVGLYVLANLMLIALGLYLMGAWHGIALLERAGRGLWEWLRPVAKRLVPISTVPKALASGAVWGWLPCGLVYSMLTTSLFTGSPLSGGLVMLAFGAGTLPNLLAAGLAAGRLQPFLQNRGVRVTAGLFVLGFGMLGLWRMATHPLGPADFCATL